MRVTAVILIVSTLVCSSVACSKTDANGAAGSSAPAGAAAPTAAKCGDGEFAESGGAFCVKLPGASWNEKLTPSKTGLGTAMNDFVLKATPERTDGYVTGFYRDTAEVDYESHQKNFEVDAKGQGGFETQGDLAKGTGKFFVYSDANKVHHCFAIAKRGKMFVKVEFATYGGKKLPDDLLAACKTVYAPG